MIVFLTVIYIILLLLAFKLKFIKANLAWKLSPIAWLTLLVVVLFIPMQWWAPSGQTIVGQYSTPIVPNVAGEVTEVAVDVNQKVQKGDLLFRIDSSLYQSQVDTLTAQLTLATTRLEEARTLAATGAGSVYDVEQFTSQVQQLEAQLRGAQYNLDETVVTAPADGYVTAVGLREGARVVSFPFVKAMSFVETGLPLFATQIHQSHLRLVEPGDSVELTYKMYPGQIFTAEVAYVVPVSPTGQLFAGGTASAAKPLPHSPFWVMLEPSPELSALELPIGATGTVAIYTDNGEFTHVIRKVVLRLEGIKNYILPF